ncbi:MAG: copper resistance CopC family protein [Gemmatimonadota bacterium]
MPKPFSRVTLGIGALGLILPAAFAMHLHLVKSTPGDSEVVTTVPTQVRLWFSQKPEAGLTTIRLLRPDSSAIALGKVARTDDSLSVSAPLSAGLVPGEYIVAWRTLSKDGHAVRGSYQFIMAPAAPARKQTSGQ